MSSAKAKRPVVPAAVAAAPAPGAGVDKPRKARKAPRGRAAAANRRKLLSYKTAGAQQWVSKDLGRRMIMRIIKEETEKHGASDDQHYPLKRIQPGASRLAQLNAVGETIRFCRTSRRLGKLTGMQVPGLKQCEAAADLDKHSGRLGADFVKPGLVA
jgi:hypothetical protein